MCTLYLLHSQQSRQTQQTLLTMGGLKDFLIQFDKPVRVYFPGEVVTGKLLINLTEQKSFKKIKVELVGKGEVLWTETRTVNNQTQTDHFTSHEEYVEHEVDVHQGPHLPPGDHVVPFTLVLPPNIPSAFEGSKGHVRFGIRTTLQ